MSGAQTADNNTTELSARVDIHAAMRGIFSQAAVGIAHGSADGEILLVNQKLCEILGFEETELLGRTSRSLGHPDDDEATQHLVDRLKRGEIDSFAVEKRYRRKDGSYVWVNTAVSGIRGPGGDLQNIVAVVQDITDRKEASEAYRRTAEQLERLYRLSDAVIRAQDVPKIYDLALAGLRETLGADRAAVLLYDPDDVMRFKAWLGLNDEYRAMAEGHSPWPKDATDPQPVLVPDVCVDESLAGLRDFIRSHGIYALGFIPLVYEHQLLGKLMIYYDRPHEFPPEEVQMSRTIANQVAFAIARKLAEEKLRLYQQIVQNSIDGIAIIDPQGHYLEQNRAHQELLGYSTEDLVGQTPAIHLGEYMFHQVASSLAERGVFRGEAKSRAKDGRLLDIELSAFAVAGEGSEPTCFVGLKRDITDRKKAELRLRESEERFRAMANSAPVMLWVSDAEGKCTWFNRPWLAFTGRQMEQELGYGWSESLHPDDLEHMKRIYRAAYEERQPVEMEYRLRRHDGEFRWILDHAVPRFSADGEFLGYIGSCKDITDRKLAQQAIMQANQQLEQRVAERTAELVAANRELEGFTYSVSHDLRAPLRAIMATSKILLEECKERLGDEQVAMLERQAENARKLGTLIDELLKLSRLSREEIVRKHVDVSALAQEVAEELSGRERCVDVEFKIAEGLRAYADQRLLRFVILNLFENACKFSPDGGEVELGFENGAFYVKDHGIGFEMEYASKLFLPFERLVRDDQFPGTGIGLANVKRIVERHQGRVWAESEPGKGATFYFTIPE